MCYRHEFTRAVAHCSRCGVALCQGCRYLYKQRAYCIDCRPNFRRGVPSPLGCIATLLALGLLVAVVQTIVLSATPPWLTSLLDRGKSYAASAALAISQSATPSPIPVTSIPPMQFAASRASSPFTSTALTVAPHSRFQVTWNSLPADVTVEVHVSVDQGKGNLLASVQTASGTTVVSPRRVSDSDLEFVVQQSSSYTLLLDNSAEFSTQKRVELRYRAYQHL